MLTMFLFSGCILNSQGADIDTEGTVIRGMNGTYGISTNGSITYRPLNLDNSFHQEGLRVRFKANISKNQNSIHTWGIAIDIIEIKDISEQKE